MLRSFETVVVGAGPAGALAAFELARLGRSVALLEKRALPRPKTCGGGLVWRGRVLLPPGLALPIERECHRVRLRLGAGAPAFEVARTDPLVTMTMRADLDQALVEAARAAGAEVLAATELRSLELDSRGAHLGTTAGELEARVLIGADGATGCVARLAGWAEPLTTIPALEAEVEADEPSSERYREAAIFDFGLVPHGYAWVFPKRAHLSIGVLSMQRGTKNLKQELDGYLRVLELRAENVRELSGYVIPIRPRRTIARKCVLLAGDAAGLVDPLTAEGISLALESGSLAARAIVESDGDAPRTCAAYERFIGSRILPELRRARWLARLVYEHPRLAQSVFTRAGRPACEALADVVCGTTSYRQLFRDPRSWMTLFGLRRSGRGPSEPRYDRAT